jgi:hypothetical protein
MDVFAFLSRRQRGFESRRTPILSHKQLMLPIIQLIGAYSPHKSPHIQKLLDVAPHRGSADNETRLQGGPSRHHVVPASVS